MKPLKSCCAVRQRRRRMILHYCNDGWWFLNVLLLLGCVCRPSLAWISSSSLLLSPLGLDISSICLRRRRSKQHQCGGGASTLVSTQRMLTIHHPISNVPRGKDGIESFLQTSLAVTRSTSALHMCTSEGPVMEESSSRTTSESKSTGASSSQPRRSYVARIQCRNLAGVISSSSSSSVSSNHHNHHQNDHDSENDRHQHKNNTIGNDHRDIILRWNAANLCVVSGETGSGKSLLIARAMELLTGGKNNKASTASSLILPGASQLSSEGSRNISKDHTVLVAHGDDVDTDTTNNKETDSSWNNPPEVMVEMELVLTGEHWQAARTVLEKDFALDASRCLSGKDNVARVVVGRTLSLQKFSSSSSSSAGRKGRLKSTCHINGQQVTLKTLTAFTSPLLTVVDAAAAATALAKPQARRSIIDTGVSKELLIETDQARQRYNRARRNRERVERELSRDSLPRSFSRDSEEDLKMLQHWIDELDAFEQRIVQFGSYAQVEDEDSVLYAASRCLAKSSWGSDTAPGRNKGSDDDDDEGDYSYSSTMYDALMDFRDAVRDLDRQLDAARNAVDSLSALSSPESARTAIERARSFLFSSVNGPESQLLENAAERSHELLNNVEVALSTCARFLEDDDKGLIRTLETARQSCPIPLEDVENLLLDWNSLARKHGILPSTLPSCHKALKNERDGNIEARELLPKLLADEEAAKNEFYSRASRLTLERQQVANRLSTLVSDRLPSLGMEQSAFRANISPRDHESTRDDEVTFMILPKDATVQGKHSGGQINEVASSGEKARILLAVECALPGSVGASCTCAGKDDASLAWSDLPPIAVVYDEIDAHVGGRAAVAMGSMLVDQSRWNQVVAITHSPSVAAVADEHVVVQRMPDEAGSTKGRNGVVVSVQSVNGLQRRKELARMASGDLATEAAEVFAEALIRDGSKAKEING